MFDTATDVTDATWAYLLNFISYQFFSILTGKRRTNNVWDSSEGFSASQIRNGTWNVFIASGKYKEILFSMGQIKRTK